MPGFREPLFLLLLLLPVLVYRLFFWRRLDASLRFPSLGLVRQLAGKAGLIKVACVHVLYLLAFTLLVTALAGPRQGKRFEKRLSEGVDLMIALDVSGSMKSVDDWEMLQRALQTGKLEERERKLTNRLQYARLFTKEFINKRKDDRLGLVIFAGYSFTKCPLTFDHELLIRMLEEVDFSVFRREFQSTAIGMAIATGVRRLVRSRARSKVLILITDGANNAGTVDPLTAAEAARALGIKVYTIGFGSNQPLMPHPRSPGHYVRSVTRIDEDTLKEIAKATGGRYFRARGGGKLSQIYSQIDAMEKSVIEKKVFMEYHELYQGFVVAALIALLTAHILRHVVLRIRQ